MILSTNHTAMSMAMRTQSLRMHDAEPPPADPTTPPADPTSPPPTDPPPTDPPPSDPPPTDPPPTDPATPPDPFTGHPPNKQWAKPPEITIDPDGIYNAQLATSDGVIGVQLLPTIAPNAVNNFLFLAKEGFYKDVPVHRMVPDFMMQSGDPTGTGMGGPGYDLPDDKVPEGLGYTPGILAMANTGAPNSGGSQFFIMTGDVPLPPTYTIFGVVTSGVDALAKINARKVVDNGDGEISKPETPFGITDITVTGPGTDTPPPTDPPPTDPPPTDPPPTDPPPTDPPPTDPPPTDPPPTDPPPTDPPPTDPPPTDPPPAA